MTLESREWTQIKVRRFVRLVQKSPLKNNKLQKCVKREYIEEFSSIPDSRTGWSNFVAMLKPFYFLKQSIRKASIDSPELSPELCRGMGRHARSHFGAPASKARSVEALCHRNASLLSAERVFVFILQALKKSRQEIGRKLQSAVAAVAGTHGGPFEVPEHA